MSSPLLARLVPLLLLALAPLAGCDSPDPDDPNVVGHLYTMTNDAGGNQVVVYDRLDDGTLDERARVSAGGNGSGPGSPMPSDPLMSQDAVILSPDGDNLYAVNAGSNSIAAFEVEADGDVEFIEAEPSGGVMPVSLTVSPDGRFLYVVHSMGTVDGGAGSIVGFSVGSDGALSPLVGSTLPLSGAPMTGPAVIAFSPDGDRLVVTEKPTNNIVTYAVNDNGLPSAQVVNPSTGVTPFGAMFTSDGTWIVSNANVPVPNMPVPNGGSATSYRLNSDGTLTVITPTSPSFGTAACWIEITGDNRYAYTTNTASSSISGYSIGSGGTLAPLSSGDELVTIGVANAAPLDMAIQDGYLYTVNGNSAGGAGFISVHRINANGTLTTVSDQAATGLPAFVTGLAAR